MKKFTYLSVLLLIITSCASNLPKPKIVAPLKNSDKLVIKWKNSSLSSTKYGNFTPAIDTNRALYVADSQGHIFKIDSTDGTLISKFNLDKKLISGIGISATNLYVNTSNAKLLVISKNDGKIKNQISLPTISLEAPQAYQDDVLVRTVGGELLRYNAQTGKLLWVYQGSAPSLTLLAYNTFLAIPPEVVLLGQSEGRLALININNGNLIWNSTIASTKGATDLDKLIDIAMKPAIHDKEICVASFNGKIACLDAVTSNIIWNKDFSSSSGIIIDEQNAYSISIDGIIYAFNKSNGSEVWHNDKLQYHNLSLPVFLNNNILTVGYDGYINLLNKNTGELAARIPSDLKNSPIELMAIDNKVFAQSPNGIVIAISQ